MHVVNYCMHVDRYPYSFDKNNKNKIKAFLCRQLMWHELWQPSNDAAVACTTQPAVMTQTVKLEKHFNNLGSLLLNASLDN